MNSLRLQLPFTVNIDLTMDPMRFKGILGLTHACKMAPNSPPLRAVIVIYEYHRSANTANRVEVPKEFICTLINEIILKIVIKFRSNESCTLNFHIGPNSNVVYIPAAANERQVRIKCDITLTAANGDLVPCKFSQMKVPRQHIRDLYERALTQYSYKQQPTQVVRPVQQQRPSLQRPVTPIDVIRAARMPQNELVLEDTGIIIIKNRTTNQIVYQGVFSMFLPGNATFIPQPRRPAYQPTYQRTQQPTNRIFDVSRIDRNTPLSHMLHRGDTPQPESRNENIPMVIAQPMKEQETTAKTQMDVEKEITSGKHYEVIDLSADDDDERTVTAETSETEELPSGM